MRGTGGTGYGWNGNSHRSTSRSGKKNDLILEKHLLARYQLLLIDLLAIKLLKQLVVLPKEVDRFKIILKTLRYKNKRNRYKIKQRKRYSRADNILSRIDLVEQSRFG